MNQSHTELAARKLAECMDYPWEHMPEQGREKMREHAKAILAAALESPERVLGDAEPRWIVNDMGELGVEVAGRFFFLYKGDNIVYGEDDSPVALHDDGTPMKYRMVGKREFGEVCYPFKWLIEGRTQDRYTEELVYTPGLSFGSPEDGAWKELPAPTPPTAPSQNAQEGLVTVRLPNLTPEQAADVHWCLAESMVDAGRIDDVRLLLFVGEAATPSPQSSEGGAEITCPRCNGSGDQEYLVGGGPDAHDETGPCSECDGTGVVAALRASSPAERVPSNLHTFLNAAAGEGLVLHGVDAADLYVELFPKTYARIVTKEST